MPRKSSVLSAPDKDFKDYLKGFLAMPSASRSWVLTMGLVVSEAKFSGKYRAADIEKFLTELAPPSELQEPWSVDNLLNEFLAERAQGGSCFVSSELKGYKPDPTLFDGPDLHRRRQELNRYLIDNHQVFLVMTDLHVPFQSAPAIDKAMALGDRYGATCAIIGGDAMDLYCFSRFVQEKQVAFDLEVENICRILNRLLLHVDEVVMFPGNHERRMKKALATANLPGSFRKYMNLDPIEIALQYLPDKTREKIRYIPSYWIKVGNLIAAHPDTFSSVQMQTAKRVQENFIARRDIFDIDDFRHVVIGHSHHAGAISWNGGMLFEAGCLTWNQDYHEESGRLAIQPWALAAGIMTFKGNKLSLADSGVFQFEA